MVVCGEEFSGAITTTRDVWMWGLGIAGQMGDGSYTSYSSPHKVAGLPPVDALSVSQAQVFGITADGSVWTWGLPGDQAHDAGAVTTTPQQVAAFFGKKRVRQLCCGRKHYVIVTTGAFGPTSTLEFRSRPPFVAGSWIRFTIQSRDVNGGECSTGGSRFSGRLSLQDSNDAKVALGLWIPDCVVEIDDNMDGSYSGRCRSATAGRFVLEVALNTQPVADSPLALDIVPGPVSPSHCFVAWNSNASTNRQLQGPPHARFCGALVLRDKWGNSTTEIDANAVVVVQITNPTNNSIVFKETCSVVDCRLSVECPDECGVYAIEIGIDGLHDDCAVGDSPWSLTVRTEPSLQDILSACRVVCVCPVIAGAGAVVCVDWDAAIVANLHGYNVKVVITRTSEHTLSPRALVRCGHALHPLIQTVPVAAANSSATFDMIVAGEYSIVATLEPTHASSSLSSSDGCVELFASKLDVLPARPHVDFTEIRQVKSQLHQLRQREVVYLTLQLRDAYGNACTRTDPTADRVTAYVAPYHTLHESTPVDVRAGAVPGTLELAVKPTSTSAYLHVLLDDMPILYSPFEVRDAVAEGVAESTPPCVDDRPVAPPLHLPTSQESLVELQRVEVTRRRASDALRRERARVQAERDRQLKQNATKRTGGGFTVQFEPHKSR
ncbi:hypothetical protein DYB32_005069 [Aphanomyces invadans]|uniref:Uncharacterized protein n=1 Tax=Aphanomyces invadans TaxID=157072 RepID=A0A3R6YYS3_9STRA|nr:hypothetical protein DYB32_005069 [Aphanomyces invadans]